MYCTTVYAVDVYTTGRVTDQPEKKVTKKELNLVGHYNKMEKYGRIIYIRYVL